MNSFEDFGLTRALNQSLAHMKYDKPTPIQAQAIPIALEGRDIMGTAQTGTGKTAAFAIPIVEKLIRNPHSAALVLTPTRELGKQIADIVRQLLGPKSTINSALIIGGEPMGKQLNQLRKRPRIIIGTPGRINDHLKRGSLEFSTTDFIVLDETDRMLDMGFAVQLETIFRELPEERQTLMFSATMPKNILNMSQRYLSNPERISVGEPNVVAKNIEQVVIRVEQVNKYKTLRSELDERDGSVIVFVKTKHKADKLAKDLRADGYTSEALHGDLLQRKRDRVMQNFRTKNFRVLIATDIAARGLDVPHIEHVVNYDLPQVAEDFVHRLGRTARAGAQGKAISFVSHEDGRKWAAIARLLDPDAAEQSGGHGARRGRGGRKSFDGNRNRSEKKAFNPDRKRAGGKKFDGDRKRSDDWSEKKRSENKRSDNWSDKKKSDDWNERPARKRAENRDFDQDRKRSNDGEFKPKRGRNDEAGFKPVRRRSDDSGFKPDRKRSDDRSSFQSDRKRAEGGAGRPDQKRDTKKSWNPDRKRTDDRAFKSDRKRPDTKAFGSKSSQKRNTKKRGVSA